MSTATLLKEKLSQVLFIEINKSIIKNTFNVVPDEQIYMPLRTSNIINKIKSDGEFKNIPVSYFIEGMFFVLGCDSDFKYNQMYRILMEGNLENWSRIIKSAIHKNVSEDNYIDAYIMLKGLVEIEPITENYSNLLWIVDKIRKSHRDFKEEEMEVIEKAKKLDFSVPYLYEAIINNEEGNFKDALSGIDSYLARGGETTEDIITLKSNVTDLAHYEEGKEHIHSNPEKALKFLLPLLDSFEEDVLLYYYIAVAYRNVGNYEKAIYYLNDAIAIDSALVEVVNELGLNYACLNNYDNAIAYFRKAFEATRSVEICTNLIMCYINKNDMEQAKLHLELAKRINSEDEIVLQLQAMIEGEN